MIEILIDEDIEESIEIKNKLVEKLVEKIISDNNKSFSLVNFIITNDNKLSQLKRDFFNQDVLTDVITFNLEEKNEPIEGEVYISFERIKENAKQFNQKISIELCRIIVHGTLHLIGFDDITSIGKEKMTTLENHYIKNMPEIL